MVGTIINQILQRENLALVGTHNELMAEPGLETGLLATLALPFLSSPMIPPLSMAPHFFPPPIQWEKTSVLQT